jgi:hypothetical protein
MARDSFKLGTTGQPQLFNCVPVLAGSCSLIVPQASMLIFKLGHRQCRGTEVKNDDAIYRELAVPEQRPRIGRSLLGNRVPGNSFFFPNLTTPVVLP